MFDPVTHVGVSIRPFGSTEPYKEYEITNRAAISNSSRDERYIEAQNERFEIVFTLRNQSPSPGRTHISTACDIESASMTSYHCHELSSSSSSGKDREFEVVHSSKAVRMNGEWRDVGFTFREMEIDPTLKLSDEEEKRELDIRGKISVKIKLGTVHGDTLSGDNDPERVEKPPGCTTKKLADECGKSHCFQSVNLRAGQPRRAFVFRPTRTKGDEFGFTFHIASRAYLLSKGVNLGDGPPSLRLNRGNQSLPSAPFPSAKKLPSPGSSKRARKDCYDNETVAVVAPLKKVKAEYTTPETPRRPSESSHIAGSLPPGTGTLNDDSSMTPISPSPSMEQDAMPSPAVSDRAATESSPRSQSVHAPETPLPSSSSTNSQVVAFKWSKALRKQMLELQLKEIEVKKAEIEVKKEEIGIKKELLEIEREEE